MNSIVEDILMHYGMPRRSGRYPYGSGENPYQHSGDFLSRVQELKKSGMSETDIAKNMGLTTTQLRTQMSLAKDERRALQVATAKGLREKGYSLNEIADKMGFANDSSVRSLLNETSENRMNQAKATADVLRKLIEEKGMIDVGTGVERELGVSKEKLNQALYMLELEGYPIYGGGVPQVTNPGKQTNIKVICPPGTEHKDIYDFENVHSVRDYISYDNGESFRKSFEYPASMDSKRLQIRYADQGGVDKDGVIELRRGVKDLSLGDSHYAQVRIMVDGTHYLKGMAVYSDNMPDGVDVIFNTNKKSGTPTKDVLKKIKDDPDNPFGSLIKEHGGQSYYDDPKGMKMVMADIMSPSLSEKDFQIDVSYMSDEEYETCMIDTFNKLEYRNIPKEKLTGEKWMEKSVNIGDQLSQVIGIYYPYPIDNYVKYVRQQKFYGRYMDDWYIMNPSKEELENLLENVCKIAAELGIHINRKKTRIVKISSKYKFLQIKYTLTDTGKVIKRINPDRVTAMRRKLKKLAVKVENEEADYDNVENMFRGWMGGHYKLLSREQRKNLIQLYEDLFSKEITIVNKKLIVSDRSA